MAWESRFKPGDLVQHQEGDWMCVEDAGFTVLKGSSVQGSYKLWFHVGDVVAHVRPIYAMRPARNPHEHADGTSRLDYPA